MATPSLARPDDSSDSTAVAGARYSLSVLHRGRTHTLELPDRQPASLTLALRQLIDDDQARVRLVHKGRKIDLEGVDGLIELPDGAKVGLIVSRAEDVASLQANEAGDRRREEVVRTRKTVAVRQHRCRASLTPQPRSTNTSGSIATLQNAPGGRFGRITPFPEGPDTPFLDKRRHMLERLATDPAIVEVCNARDFHVGELCVLHTPSVLTAQHRAASSSRSDVARLESQRRREHRPAPADGSARWPAILQPRRACSYPHAS